VLVQHHVATSVDARTHPPHDGARTLPGDVRCELHRILAHGGLRLRAIARQTIRRAPGPRAIGAAPLEGVWSPRTNTVGASPHNPHRRVNHRGRNSASIPPPPP
jgi:hypothetical protein